MGLSYAVEALRLTQKNKQARLGQSYTSYDRPASARGSVSVDETGFPLMVPYTVSDGPELKNSTRSKYPPHPHPPKPLETCAKGFPLWKPVCRAGDRVYALL